MQRRHFLASTAGAACLALVPFAAGAEQAGIDALPDDVAEARAAILDGRVPQEGGIEIDAPSLAENGAQVPVTLRVDSPMTAADHVIAIHILATRNPAPGIGHFHLTPHLTRAEVFTRLRLAEEQSFLVLAELSDGRVRQAAARVMVTQGGCRT